MTEMAPKTDMPSMGSISSMASPPLPRIGALGVGWIGRHRLAGVLDDGAARLVAVADPDADAARDAAALGGAAVVDGLDALLDRGLDGLLIATPSALHAEQARAALDRGVAVFCQKPLARTAAEACAVVDAARRADRLLGVDFSYRHIAGVAQMRELVEAGALGRVFAVELVFHNAYGPDKPWFRDPARSGGGCLIDLGVHLVDLALWMLPGARVVEVAGQCFAGGVAARPDRCEDYAAATLRLADGAVVRLVTSWNLHAGQDAVIEAAFRGTAGAVTLHNVGGSFYDFRAEHHTGTRRRVIAEPPDAWGARAAVAWARRLRHDRGFDPAVEQAVAVAEVIDRAYGRA